MTMWSISLYRFRSTNQIFIIRIIGIRWAVEWMISYIFNIHIRILMMLDDGRCIYCYIYLRWDITNIWKSIGVWLKCSRCSINLQNLLYIFFPLWPHPMYGIELSDAYSVKTLSSASRDVSSIHFSFHSEPSNPVKTMRKIWKMISLQ